MELALTLSCGNAQQKKLTRCMALVVARNSISKINLSLINVVVDILHVVSCSHILSSEAQ